MKKYQITVTARESLGQFAATNLEQYLTPMCGAVNVEIEKVDA